MSCHVDASCSRGAGGLARSRRGGVVVLQALLARRHLASWMNTSHSKAQSKQAWQKRCVVKFASP